MKNYRNYNIKSFLFKFKLSFTRITSIYFNPKRPIENPKKTYFGLEIADLCAYPFYKYLVYGTKDICFDVLESKIYKYPDYKGSGIKIFP